jgi:pimeloyl-ACP methyl ester carboxylesterase
MLPSSHIVTVAIFAAMVLLTSCVSTVATRQVSATELWRTWRKGPEWNNLRTEALNQLDVNGLRKQWKTDPDKVLAELRHDSGKKTDLQSVVAILAADLATERESKLRGADVLGLWLIAAEGAYYAVKESSKKVLIAEEAEHASFMVNLYNLSVSHFVDLYFKRGGLRNGKNVDVAVLGGNISVSVNNLRTGALDPVLFDEFIPTNKVKIEGFTAKGRLPGVGATFSGVINRIPEREHLMAYTTRRGLNIPVTVAILFPEHPSAAKKSHADISLIDPTMCREIPFWGRPLPVSHDTVAPLALELNGISGTSLGLGGLLRVNDRMKLAGLYMLQPYDPNRIPVLMIHGLQSSPVIWRNLIAELQADPALSAKYQFWVFYYPSGVAIPKSRYLISQKTHEVIQHFDPKAKNLASRNVVVIGHSMGGVLCRSLITDVGDRFWKQFSTRDFSELKAPKEKLQEARDTVFFKPMPQVKRAIFIAAPHRGADLAQSWLGSIGSSLVSLPSDLLKFNMMLIKENVSLLRTDFQQNRVANSINSLRPDAPIYAALNSSPFAKGVPYHSIVGDRGRGDTPNSSDGFVHYSSSHLDGAESELIVPTGHQAYESPLAVDEIKRILKKHANN